MNVTEVVVEKLFSVNHEELVKGDTTLSNTITIIKANNREEALTKYNIAAKMKSDYPHYWNQACLGAVKQLTVLE